MIICAPPHFRGEHSKISERNSPRCSPPFPGGAPKILRIPPGYPQIFFALRAKKKCLKTRFTLENRKKFLCASREKGTKNLNLPLKTAKFFFALRAKYHFYLLKNTQNPVQLYICPKHKEFVVNFFLANFEIHMSVLKGLNHFLYSYV